MGDKSCVWDLDMPAHVEMLQTVTPELVLHLRTGRVYRTDCDTEAHDSVLIHEFDTLYIVLMCKENGAFCLQHHGSCPPLFPTAVSAATAACTSSFLASLTAAQCSLLNTVAGSIWRRSAAAADAANAEGHAHSDGMPGPEVVGGESRYLDEALQRGEHGDDERRWSLPKIRATSSSLAASANSRRDHDDEEENKGPGTRPGRVEAEEAAFDFDAFPAGERMGEDCVTKRVLQHSPLIAVLDGVGSPTLHRAVCELFGQPGMWSWGHSSKPLMGSMGSNVDRELGLRLGDESLFWKCDDTALESSGAIQALSSIVLALASQVPP